MPGNERRSALALLKRRDLSIYLACQLFGYTCSWVQIVALGWVVLQTTDSPFAVGAVTAAATVPAIFISPVAGAFADRWGKKIMLVLVQVGLALTSIAFGLAVFYGFGLSYYLALAVAAGIVNAIDGPVRQSLMYDLGGKENVAESSALSALTFNSARAFSGPVAGYLLTAVGAASCFFLNAAAYLVVLAGLVAIREPAHAAPAKENSVFGDLLELFNDRRLKLLYVSLAIYSLSTLNHIQIFTVYVKLSLNADAKTLGDFVGWLGAGALASSIALIWMDRSDPRALRLSALALPCCFLALAGTENVLVAEATACVFGAAIVQYLVRMAALVQTFATPDTRGKVTGLFFMCLVGPTPLSLLLSGAIAQLTSVGAALVTGALLALIGYWALARALPAGPASEPQLGEVSDA